MGLLIIASGFADKFETSNFVIKVRVNRKPFGTVVIVPIKKCFTITSVIIPFCTLAWDACSEQTHHGSAVLAATLRGSSSDTPLPGSVVAMGMPQVCDQI